MWSILLTWYESDSEREREREREREKERIFGSSIQARIFSNLHCHSYQPAIHADIKSSHSIALIGL